MWAPMVRTCLWDSVYNAYSEQTRISLTKQRGSSYMPSWNVRLWPRSKTSGKVHEGRKQRWLMWPEWDFSQGGFLGTTGKTSSSRGIFEWMHCLCLLGESCLQLASDTEGGLICSSCCYTEHARVLDSERTRYLSSWYWSVKRTAGTGRFYDISWKY